MDHLDFQIATRDLNKSLGGRQILKDVSLGFPKGKTTVILGESGAGKSVLLKHLCGLMSADSGSIMFNERDIQNFTEEEWLQIREQITYIFQHGALFDSMSVYDNVAFPLKQKWVSANEIPTRVTESLESVGLPDVGTKFPSALSGGMRKRVALARGLVTKPDVILYDEPTTGLDPVMTAQVAKLIKSFEKKYGITSIVVTHDIKFAKEIADYLVMIYEGQIHLYETKENFIKSNDLVVSQFLEGNYDGPIDPLRERN